MDWDPLWVAKTASENQMRLLLYLVLGATLSMGIITHMDLPVNSKTMPILCQSLPILCHRFKVLMWDVFYGYWAPEIPWCLWSTHSYIFFENTGWRRIISIRTAAEKQRSNLWSFCKVRYTACWISWILWKRIQTEKLSHWKRNWKNLWWRLNCQFEKVGGVQIVLLCLKIGRSR